MLGRPPKRLSTPDQEAAAAAFVDAAASATASGAPETLLRPSGRKGREEGQDRPWEAPYVREDVTKGYALRLPEPLYLKLKYVSERTGQSMNVLCRNAVEDVVEGLLADLERRR